MGIYWNRRDFWKGVFFYVYLEILENEAQYEQFIEPYLSIIDLETEKYRSL